jgi:hypothetical protein
MHPMDQEMRRCVDDCLACHRVCLTTLSQHCLDVGGKHVEPRHTRLMLACAEICRTSAFFMELGTEFHKRTCAVCAEVCAECAKPDRGAPLLPVRRAAPVSQRLLAVHCLRERIGCRQVPVRGAAGRLVASGTTNGGRRRP